MQTLAIAPDEDGYTFVEPGSFLYQELEGGLPRTRADLINASKTVGVQWTVGVADYQYLCNFNSANLSNDSEPFLIPLFIDEVEAKDYEAIILPGTFGLVSQSGETYVVGAQLEVTVTPATDDEYEDDTTSNAGTGVTGAGYYAGSTEISSGSGVQLLFGSYHLNGQNAILRRQSKIVTPVKGSFVLNGQVAGLNYSGKKILANYGNYSLNGQATALTYSNVVNAPFAQVQLLLHGDGSNGGTVITDSSGANRTATIVGTVVTSTTSPAVGTASLAFTAPSRVHFPQSTSLDLGANDFTIQMRVKYDSLPTSSVPGNLISKWFNTGSGQRQYRLVAQYTTKYVEFRYTIADVETLIAWEVGTSITTGVWYLFELCRVGGTVHFFVDGVKKAANGSDSISGALDAISSVTSVGAILIAGSTYEGHPGNIDELRLVIGTGLYTANHTPYLGAYPNS